MMQELRLDCFEHLTMEFNDRKNRIEREEDIIECRILREKERVLRD